MSGGGIVRCISFSGVLALCKMHTTSSWNLTQIIIIYGNNHYTMGASNIIYIYIYIYVYTSLSPQSHTGSLLFLESLWPSICHLSYLAGLQGCILCLQRANISLCWKANTGTSMCRCPYQNVTCDFILASPAVLCMSCSSHLNGL